MNTYLNRVAVRQRQDGGISITRFAVSDMEKYNFTDEDLFINWYMNRISPGEPFHVIDESNIPKDANGEWDKSSRAFWSLKDNKVEIDAAKVAKEQEKTAKKNAVLGKLKITEEDAKILREI